MTGWRGDQRASGIWGGAVTLWAAVAAVIVAAFALSISKQILSVAAIGIAGAVIFGLTLIIAVMQKSISDRRTRRYLNEEHELILEIRRALEKVERDLAPSSERSGSLDADMRTVNQLVAKIKATSGIHSLAISVADHVYGHTFRSQDPEASARTVIGAKETCDRALDGYVHLEQVRKTTGRRLRLRVRHSEPNPKKISVSKRNFRALAATGFRIPRGKHKEIAYTPSADTLMSRTVTSPKAEGGSTMSGIATLPGAAEYQETLTRLFAELGDLNDVPAFPQHIAAGAMLGWQLRARRWLGKAEKIRKDAIDLANKRERQPYPSVQLSGAMGDAEDGLLWIQDFVDHRGDSLDSDEFPRQCEKTIAAISDIVAYAAGLRG